MAKKDTWRDLLLMAGIESPIWWSGHKHKRVFKELEKGDLSHLKQVQVREGNVFNLTPTLSPFNVK